MPRFLAFLISLASLNVMTAPVMAQERVVPQSRQEVTLSFAPVVKQAAPAVVNIYARRIVKTRPVNPLLADPFMRHFFGDVVPQGPVRERVQNSLGSGVIVRADGVVLTNNHVISGATEIKVVLNDRREFEAEVVGTDERTDLAVLRLQDASTDLPTLPLGDSEALEVGDLVLAIGNPFGVGQTVTSGIVSALSRATSGTSYNAFIQTDAAINPGNSGGALVTVKGELVGINTQIFSKDGGNMGIGFAIPTAMVSTVLDGILDHGKVVRPWLGAQGQAVAPDIAASLGLDRPGGVLINQVARGGPAEEAGLQVGDVVVSIGGADIITPQSLRYRLATRRIGETVDLEVLRNGAIVHLALRLVPPSEEPARDESRISGRVPLDGAVVANLNPALAEEQQRSFEENTVVIVGVDPKSYAGVRLGVEKGDVVREVNGTKITTVAGLKALLAGASPSTWMIVVQRGDQLFNLRVR